MIELKKILKIIIICVTVLVLFICGVGLYIGNYFYDYTLNPHSKHNIVDKLEIDEEAYEKSRVWLTENGEDVSILSQDDLKLHASLIEQGSRIYVIMIHGYHSDGTGIISPIKKMKKEGYNVLVPDLRGHGASEGDYIGMGWDDRKDILLWIDYLIQRNRNISIFLYGVSMGGATVMNVSGEVLPVQVKGIIEDCGYTSVWDLFKSYVDMEEYQSEIVMHLVSLVTKIRAGYFLEDVKPIEQVKKSHTPMLFIHGDKDDFVPFEMLDKLYQAASCPKEKLVIHGAGHADSYSVNAKAYYQTIFDFIRKYQ